MKTIGLLKENKELSIVALTPENVRSLSDHYSILVEKNAGIQAGYTNEAYESAGGEVIDDRVLLFKTADILVTYGSDLESLKNDHLQTVISCLPVRDEFEKIVSLKGKKVNFFSLDMLPRTTIAQAMDVLSSFASLSGYQSVLLGFERLKVVGPMISGAGGTLYPAKVLILGAGVAGLQAIATAKRLGGIVYAFDVRKQTKTEVESLGAKFIEIEGALEDNQSGGYAIQQSNEFNQLVQSTIAKVVCEFDLIITTAKIPGKKAPILITKEAMATMKKGAVIIDLAASTGGNTEPSEANDVTILGESHLYNDVPTSASILLGNNMQSYLNYFRMHEENILHDEILQSTLIIEDGKVVNKKIIEQIKEY